MHDQPLLVFDGDCGFCMNSLRVLRRMLPDWPRAVAWQRVDLAALGLTESDVRSAAWWVAPGAPPQPGARAFSRLLQWQPARGWRLLGHLMAVPPISWVAAVGYRMIARNRHRLPGNSRACLVRR